MTRQTSLKTSAAAQATVGLRVCFLLLLRFCNSNSGACFTSDMLKTNAHSFEGLIVALIMFQGPFLLEFSLKRKPGKS